MRAGVLNLWFMNERIRLRPKPLKLVKLNSTDTTHAIPNYITLIIPTDLIRRVGADEGGTSFS